jgi:hypothetical protein
MGGAPFNLSGVLSNPTVQLYKQQTVIAQNDDWQTTDPLCLSPAESCGGVAEIEATGIDPCQPNPAQTVAPPDCNLESAMVVTLPPGNYAAIVRGVSGATGIGLVEVFDVDAGLSRLTNSSARALVQTGPHVLIGGFIIGETASNTVLIRARGPSMGGAPFNLSGVLANPTIRLYKNQTVIAQNDDWQTTDPLCLSPAEFCGGMVEIQATGIDPCQPNPGQTVAPPDCNLESAMVVTLPPGNYTAHVSGVSGGTGIGLVEIFEVSQ